MDTLTTTRYRMLITVAFTLASPTVVATVIFFGIGVVVPQGPFLLLAAICAVVTAGYALSIHWLRQRRPLEQSLVPISIVLIGGLVFISLLIPPLAGALLPFLILIVLLTSITGQRALVTIVTIVSTVLGMSVLGWVLLPAVASRQEATNAVLAIIALGGLLVLGSIIAQWFILVQSQAILITTQRALDAEHAQQATEMARQVLEVQYAEQQRLLGLVAELETPSIRLTDSTMLVPIIGSVDTHRAAAIQDRLLDTVHTTRVRRVVLDLKGIALLDTAVVASIGRIVAALTLLGTEVVVSGITAPVAASLVQMGCPLDDVPVVRSPQEALELWHA